MRKLSTIALVALSAAAGAFGLIACGGSDSGSGGSGMTATSGGSNGATAASDGKTIFVENCGTCHTLSAAGTDGAVGPNLDDLKPDYAEVSTQVMNGGGGMPAFQGVLSPADIQAVSKYVADSAGK